ncbi:IclR family transcriptional regulator [Metallumcola ferriviriculae]|uniref:Glycerol operon regulatory protein n=1 Tax=Metallumcola ferriviriculae TaxID=3039180 RepID=A0AAU0UMW9_9FIRM|nr:IclR family transcriptional regulator [Desulfitibacteraceae bacterium MK1]
MNNGKNTIKSIDKALDVLEILADEKRPIGVTELSKLLVVNKSTLHGTLNTLLNRGYVEQDSESGKYLLGISILGIANAALQNLDLRNKAKPVLKKLSDRHNETVHMVVLRQGEVVYIEKQESVQSIRIHTEIGTRLPAHCTGVGKVLLAWMEPEERKKIFRSYGFPKFTLNTITDEETMERHLAEVRSKGHAIDNEEIEEGLRCVAAPIRDYSGKVIAGISIAGPSLRMPLTKLEEMSDSVTEAALEISQSLGF